MLACSSHLSSQVVGILVSLLYSMPYLTWTDETDHAELFSGCMSVTRAEVEERTA